MDYLENKLTAEQYEELRSSVGWKLFSREQSEKALERSYTLVAYDESNIIAMARLIGDGMYYVIADVIVKPEFQHKGIGTELINRLLEHIQRELPIGGRVSVQLIAEKGKEQFYQKLGFKKIPHEFCGSGMRKVLYNNLQ